MKNQGRRQCGRKRAVIYFLTAFFIACIGIIVANYLKGEVTTERKFSTMDMFPTTLAALGVQMDGNRLGLGTNLFSGQKTLTEELGEKYINQELKKNDKKYNGFY